MIRIPPFLLLMRQPHTSARVYWLISVTSLLSGPISRRQATRRCAAVAAYIPSISTTWGPDLAWDEIRGHTRPWQQDASATTSRFSDFRENFVFDAAGATGDTVSDTPV